MAEVNGSQSMFRCGQVEIDLEKFGQWEDKNNNGIRERDEFVPQAEGITDEKWRCYNEMLKLLQGNAEATPPKTYELVVKPETGDEAQVIDRLVKRYAPAFAPGTLSVTVDNRSHYGSNNSIVVVGALKEKPDEVLTIYRDELFSGAVVQAVIEIFTEILEKKGEEGRSSGKAGSGDVRKETTRSGMTTMAQATVGLQNLGLGANASFGPAYQWRGIAIGTQGYVATGFHGVRSKDGTDRVGRAEGTFEYGLKPVTLSLNDDSFRISPLLGYRHSALHENGFSRGLEVTFIERIEHRGYYSELITETIAVSVLMSVPEDLHQTVVQVGLGGAW